VTSFTSPDLYVKFWISLSDRLGYLLMIASYTTPSALVQTVMPCKGTWILWSDGVVHGA